MREAFDEHHIDPYLRARHMEFSRLLEKVPAASYICNAEGLITYFNQRAVELWGREPKLNHEIDRFCGSFRLFSIEGSPISHDRCWMAKALQEGKEFNGHEIVIERPDGSCRTALAYANPFHDESGNIFGAVNVLVDITSRRRAEETLREADRDRSEIVSVLAHELHRSPARIGKEAHAALEKAHNELEGCIRKRTSELRNANQALNSEIGERKRIELALRESEGRLRGLSGHLQLVLEEQNAKIAREVHDELGGTLTVLKLGLSSVLDKINDPAWSRDKLISLLTLTDSAIRSVKRISTSLRPGMLDTLGLIATIKWHVNEFSELTGIAHELHLPNYIRLSVDRNTAVFRIIQEALTNIARHAQATKIVIHLWKHKGQLVVEIEDDGKGITEEEMINPKSFGIFGMFERSHCLGGRLIIRRGEIGGTVITLRLPLDDVKDGVAK